MQFRIAFLALLSASLASSSVILTDQAKPDSVHAAAFKVPGKNPLQYCGDPAGYIGQIDFVDLTPNPPVKGSTLSIVANGTFTQDIEEGSTVHLQVKFQTYITLINTVQDLCENLPRIDLECPIEKGVLSIQKEVQIPAQVPPGKYDVLADVISPDGKTISCMTAIVSF